MIWALIAIVMFLWLLGVILKFTAGGLLHLLLLVAAVMLIVRLIRGRRSI